MRLASKARTQQAKEALYRNIVDGLQKNLGVSGNDVIVTINENGDADWSFGHGVAQFITGDV